MKRKMTLTSMKDMSEINLTPLIDLTFLLLITFIITFPLIEQGISIDLPKATADKLEQEKSRTVTLDRAGELFLDNARVTLEEFDRMMTEASARDPLLGVMVRADEAVRYGEVIKVMKVLHKANISKMSLVTESE